MRESAFHSFPQTLSSRNTPSILSTNHSRWLLQLPLVQIKRDTLRLSSDRGTRRGRVTLQHMERCGAQGSAPFSLIPKRCALSHPWNCGSHVGDIKMSNEIESYWIFLLCGISQFSPRRLWSSARWERARISRAAACNAASVQTAYEGDGESGF